MISLDDVFLPRFTYYFLAEKDETCRFFSLYCILEIKLPTVFEDAKCIRICEVVEIEY